MEMIHQAIADLINEHQVDFLLKIEPYFEGKQIGGAEATLNDRGLTIWITDKDGGHVGYFDVTTEEF